MSAVLLCVDGSPASIAAAHIAIRVARDRSAELHALFVVEDAGFATRVDEAIDGHGSRQQLVDSGDALLARIRSLASAAKVAIVCATETGEPFERILEFAQRLDPDFIVMGRTGRRGPGRALLGSEAERVLEFTDWPVIVVPTSARPPREDRDAST